MSNEELNTRFAPLIQSDEVLIVLKKANDSDAVDFSVLMSDVNCEDPKKEAETKLLAAIATGMITIASKQTQLCAQVGMTTLSAAQDIEDSKVAPEPRMDVV